MRRRLFTILSAVSLLLCVATCVLWVRSYVRAEEWLFDRTTQSAQTVDEYLVFCQKGGRAMIIYQRIVTRPPLNVGSADGRIEVTYLSDRDSSLRGLVDVPRAKSFPWRTLGVDFQQSNYTISVDVTETGRAWSVAAPHWLAAVPLASPPLIWIVRRRRRLAPAAGRCPACGYDLRATPGRCPECGTPATGAAA